MKHNITIVEKTSKNGNKYATLNIKFENGYQFSCFLNNEQHFILSQLLNN